MLPICCIFILFSVLLAINTKICQVLFEYYLPATFAFGGGYVWVRCVCVGVLMGK
ncbi:unnamed protein product [Discosporangium mesarthrocarpum]